MAVLAVGDGAQCAAALMRRPRPETQQIKAALLIDVAASDPLQPKCAIVSDPEEFRVQIEASAHPMWRRVVAESYAGQLMRCLSLTQHPHSDVRYA